MTADAHELHVLVTPEEDDAARPGLNREGVPLFRVFFDDRIQRFAILDEFDRPFQAAQILREREQVRMRSRVPFAVA